MLNSTFLLYRNYNEPLYIADAVTDLQNQCQRFQGDASINTLASRYFTWVRIQVEKYKSIRFNRIERMEIRRFSSRTRIDLPRRFTSFPRWESKILFKPTFPIPSLFRWILSRSRSIVEMIIRKTCHAIYQKQIPSRVHFSWLKRSERASRARQRIGGVQAWKENDKKGKEKKRRTWNLFLPARRLKEFGAGQVKQTSMREKGRKSFVFAYIEAVPRPYIGDARCLNDPQWSFVNPVRAHFKTIIRDFSTLILVIFKIPRVSWKHGSSCIHPRRGV